MRQCKPHEFLTFFYQRHSTAESDIEIFFNTPYDVACLFRNVQNS